MNDAGARNPGTVPGDIEGGEGDGAPPRRVAFCTFGCRLNQYDTESLRSLLEGSRRYRAAAGEEAPEIIVVNTCSVTARADASARKAIRRMAGAHPEAPIVVTGCYAQRAPEELAALPGVALVVGAADRARVVELVDELPAGRARVGGEGSAGPGSAGGAGPEGLSPPSGPRVAVSPVEEATTFLEIPIAGMAERARAHLKIQEGCNESCTFCIVPATRGRSRSRVPARVLEQARRLVESGFAEIVLTGVHLGDYGRDLAGGEAGLVPLIRRLLEVPGLERLRLSSIEPASISEPLLELAAAEPRFARHFHIPLQSASDPVLARMRRRYRARDFVRVVERIAELMPGAGIGSDVICGFPGETDEDFQATFDCLAALPVTYLHAFSYSVRPGSEAEPLGDPVPGDVKKRRIRALKRLAADKGARARERMAGRVVTVVPEVDRVGPARPSPGALVGGLTDTYFRVDFPAPADRPLAPVERVRIVETGAARLRGEICPPGTPLSEGER